MLFLSVLSIINAFFCLSWRCAENSGSIIGIQMASAYVGSTFIPPLFGLLGRLLGFEIMPVFLAIFVILMITMTELTFRVTKKHEKKGETDNGIL